MKYAIFLLAAASAAVSQPRPEFPQPQFQRAQWLTLNGAWDFDFDDGNIGLDANWSALNHKFAKAITVPFCFESKLSGIGITSFHPWVWYSRSVTLPSTWASTRTLLHFGAVDYRSSVWINGALAGSHEGGNTPFEFDITPLLHSGANRITVRAEDPPTDRYIPRGKQYWEPKSRSIFYTRTTGIWQPVWLEGTGSNYLTRVHTVTSNDGVVRFEAEVARDEADLAFSAVISRAGLAVSAASGNAKDHRALAITAVLLPQLWSVATPNLYDVRFELRKAGAVVDTVTSYFGFRTVAVEGSGKVLLNDRPTYLKLVLDQGYWPESILTPPSDEAIQFDIRAAKDMGFNGARKHQKLEDPRFLYWADKMGYLVSSEMANAYLYDETAVQQFTHEWTSAVLRDYNHPSIIIWVPINESWGVPNLREKRQQDYLKFLYALTRALDSTRLVIDNDGWEHTNMTDLFAIHDYTSSGDALFNRYSGAGKPARYVPDNARAALAPGFEYNGTPLYLSEFGGIAFIPAGASVPSESWGYSGVEKTADSAMERLRGIYSAIGKLPSIVGICYTQLTDVEQEVNGLLTYDRKLKFDPKVLANFNDQLR